MRTTIGIAALLCCFSAPLWAQDNSVTDTFDGPYISEIRLAEYWRNAKDCLGSSSFELNLVDGYFQSEPTGMANGFITGDGYFKGEFLVGDTELMPFEGTAEPDGRITGTAMKDDASCAWEVTLSPTSQND